MVRLRRFLIFPEKIKSRVFPLFLLLHRCYWDSQLRNFAACRNSSWMSLNLSHHFVVDWKPPCLMPCAEQPVYPFGVFGVEPRFEYEKQM